MADFTDTLEETVTVTDEYSGAITQTRSETVTASDSHVKAITKTHSETVTVTDNTSTVHVPMTVKYIRTTADGAATEVAAYLNENVTRANIISINVVPIASDNFGVLIVHT